MRISTNQIFMRGLNNMLAQQMETLKLQQQMSSQKNYNLLLMILSLLLKLI